MSLSFYRIFCTVKEKYLLCSVLVAYNVEVGDLMELLFQGLQTFILLEMDLQGDSHATDAWALVTHCLFWNQNLDLQDKILRKWKIFIYILYFIKHTILTQLGRYSILWRHGGLLQLQQATRVRNGIRKILASKCRCFEGGGRGAACERIITVHFSCLGWAKQF